MLPGIHFAKPECWELAPALQATTIASRYIVTTDQPLHAHRVTVVHSQRGRATGTYGTASACLIEPTVARDR